MALPRRVKQWSLRTLRVKLIKIGAKVVKHSRYVIFQMAEVMVSKRLFSCVFLEKLPRKENFLAAQGDFGIIIDVAGEKYAF